MRNTRHKTDSWLLSKVSAAVLASHCAHNQWHSQWGEGWRPIPRNVIKILPKFVCKAIRPHAYCSSMHMKRAKAGAEQYCSACYSFSRNKKNIQCNCAIFTSKCTSLAAGLRPDPLGELTALPSPISWILGVEWRVPGKGKVRAGGEKEEKDRGGKDGRKGEAEEVKERKRKGRGAVKQKSGCTSDHNNKTATWVNQPSKRQREDHCLWCTVTAFCHWPPAVKRRDI